MHVSKLAEKIRRVSRIEAQQLGFVTSRASKDATMVLVGLAKDANEAADLAKRGADAVLIGAGGKGASPSDAKQAGDAIAGAMLDGKSTATAFKDGGFDFVAFDPDKTASTAVLEENIGYVILLPRDVSDIDLRAIESFQLDAIDVGALERDLTVRKQIDLRRVFALTRKPLMATVPGDISVEALQALRDTNVVVVAGDGASSVERLRKTIDALPPRTRRREEGDRPTPLVPRASGGGDEEHDHDDD
jgi:hypothetical protein